VGFTLANDGAPRNGRDYAMTQPAFAPVERVTITDIDIPFGRLVAIFIKWALAAIPATIIVTLILMVVMGILGAIFGLGWMMRS
jgi:hypothetical protein